MQHTTRLFPVVGSVVAVMSAFLTGCESSFEPTQRRSVEHVEFRPGYDTARLDLDWAELGRSTWVYAFLGSGPDVGPENFDRLVKFYRDAPFLIDRLEPGQTYYAMVFLADAAENVGPRSEVAEFRVGADNLPGLSAPGELLAATIAPEFACLEWAPASFPDPDELFAKPRYELQIWTAQAPSWNVLDAWADSPAFVRGLSPGEVRFRVVAIVDRYEMSSSAPDPLVVQAPIEGNPEPPSDVTIERIGARTFRLEWRDESSQENGYVVRIRTCQNLDYFGTRVPFCFDRAPIYLAANTTTLTLELNAQLPDVKVEVQAYNDFGESVVCSHR